MTDEDLLLWMLNSTPVIDGRRTDRLGDPAARGGTGTGAELTAVRTARDRLQGVVRGDRPAADLAPLLEGVHRSPVIGDTGLEWQLDAPADRLLAVRAVLAWAELHEQHPGRLRACANDECRLFLLDRSRAGTARWCSMATCGNRMKARRHQGRYGRIAST
ncbi:CGNR zinc finger domain-containing protein [Actinoplanes friuliensis]|jgi:predicted RNA-binding Zn ribbon-like protein|uniref:Zinc finger CGNR domain-containing protein n=1 Tax=Actinoplanes friuliensis DSM 7358 TaxID=1246995 RepID=U5W2U6_9ACTN|nr:CGNR zinc finger domain-containing protein [Actinoplanes friuliensis]AGZ42310.1 hypothetical protein AFR_20190 [Actinoplanes friuliensis DSM 7358]